MAAPPVAGVMLDVPYLTQSEALCGGAAAAMVFRYWGETHAGVEQFAPLVDRDAGGIADDVLIDAIEQRGWQTTRIAGSVDALREAIGRRRPVIILLDTRGSQYHYVVVTGVEPDAVIIHDPSWGPARRLPFGELIRRWRPADFWALVVLPSAARPTTKSATTPVEAAAVKPQSFCGALLDRAIARVRERGLADADAAFGEVRTKCPDAAGPFRELAGVRFAQHRWNDAAALAGEAIARDAHDRYAWDVLGSSRFVQDDVTGALQAWNQAGKPRLDHVNITGLEHARYESIAEMLALTPDTILTAGAFARARRRLGELPDQSSSRLALRPAQDGFATVDVVIAERELHPHGPVAWAAEGAKAAVNREIEVNVPGGTGQGELWSASWRWWSARPRVALAFAAPRSGTWPGVWRVDGSWESQRYAAGSGAFLTETRTHAGLSMSDWVTGAVRYGVSVGFDEWNNQRRTAAVGAQLERRFAGDRVSVTAAAVAFVPVSSGAAFQSAALSVAARTSTDASGLVFAAGGGVTAVSASAPFALWPGAGDGHARAALLRAHPLLEDGAIVGPAFGRTLTSATGEVQRWVDRASPVRVGLAAFADAARASRRMASAAGLPWQVDAGIGLRIRMPGAGGTLRADFAHGVRDGANAFTVGWQY